MCCSFSASGVQFDVDAFLLPSGLTGRRWHLGELRTRRGAVYASSGFSLEVSDAEFTNLPQQIGDATAFLKKHHAALTLLSTSAGVFLPLRAWKTRCSISESKTGAAALRPTSFPLSFFVWPGICTSV